ncbi:hypothetical protein J5N97_025713 [Dioscorea zingiberensis]|uniref:Uncharacterized protein n=1 Tax=Dioscorea zingiberensis TaxID=325984 RepID=A0A9D5H619_9LILI|nr:hypothetical protein J5N97_025713 [Dioscorea zingiberensis]
MRTVPPASLLRCARERAPPPTLTLTYRCEARPAVAPRLELGLSSAISERRPYAGLICVPSSSTTCTDAVRPSPAKQETPVRTREGRRGLGGKAGVGISGE